MPSREEMQGPKRPIGRPRIPKPLLANPEKQLTLEETPAIALMQPLPVAALEDTLPENKKAMVRFIANNPTAQTGWVAEQLHVEVEEIQALMANPKAREYARSYMAVALDDAHTHDDLMQMAIRGMMQLANSRPQDYAELNEDGVAIFTLERLKKAPPGVVVQLDLSRGRIRPTFVDSMAARKIVVESYTQLVAGKQGRGGDGGVTVNVGVLADPQVREQLRASLRGELQSSQDQVAEAEVVNG